MNPLTQAREALQALLKRDYRNTCQHHETHRGGAIWEICDMCGCQWADDKGGKPEWQDPPEWGEAQEAIAAIDAALCAAPAAPAEPVQPVVQEPVARFCPGCGSVGDVPDTYRDCCPDGNRARVIPAALARQCHDLFALALKGDAAPAAPAEKWEDAEEWMPLAWALCADECGEDACTELVWEGGPVPEPWGDRWLKYEDEAKRLIALVREHVPSLAAAPKPADAQE